MTLYKAYNGHGELLAFACRLDTEVNTNGGLLVRTGSASLWAASVVPLNVGDVIEWKIDGEYVKIEITKINRKTVKAVVRNTGQPLSFTHTL